LHENKIIHYDIKCQNILINSEEGRVAIVDFGESVMLKDINEFDNENRGTEFIKSPEML
jgi:serine/threonine protein kinase